MGIKKTVFFDNKLVVDAYIKNKRLDEADTLLIAMNPAIHSYLKQKGFKVQNTLPYFTNDSHIKVLEKSQVLIDWLIKNSDFIDLNSGIKFAFRDSFVFWIRLAIHNCLWMIEIISNAVELHKPEVISASFSGKKIVSSLYLEPEERYLGYIGSIIAHQKGLKYEDISLKGTNDYDITRLTNNLIYLKYILKYGRFQLWKLNMVLKGLFANGKPVFFTTPFYQMDKLALQLQKEYPKVNFLFLQGPVNPSFKPPDFFIKSLWGGNFRDIEKQRGLFNKLISTIEKETEIFSYRNISFVNVISKKIKEHIADYIIGLMLWAIKLNQFIKVSEPLAFISNGNRADDVILAEVCQTKNIPTILISHGSHIRPKNLYESIEWSEHGRKLLSAPFSYLALQSPLAEGYLEFFPTTSKIAKTGPLIWGKPVNIERSKFLLRKIFDGRYDFGSLKVVVHAGTPKPTNSLRLYVYETPDEYVHALCDLADAIEKIPDTILIIKFRPSKEIGVEDLKTLVPFSNRIILSVDEPFLDVLGMADLFVSFSSTCIEEALQNKIPVLLYGGGGRYLHVPAHEIKHGISSQSSAVYHVKEAKNLEYAVNSIFEMKGSNGKNGHLFDSYIYPQNVRVSLVDLLKNDNRL